MAKTNLASAWSTNGELVFTANASGSGSMVMNLGTPLVGGTLSYPVKTITELTSAANYTMTAAQLLTGVVNDTTSTGGISVTLPTVANVVALIPGWQVGTTFELFYRNGGNQTVTMYAGATWTMLGTNTILAANAKAYDFVIASGTTGTMVAKGAVVA
jgi:hypothetical protein